MAKEARIFKPDGKKVSPSDIYSYNVELYCVTDGCSAPMSIVAMGDEHAYFRSKRISAHKYSKCIRHDISFNPDEYDANLFHINKFSESILAGRVKADIHGRNGGSGGKVGHGKHIAVNTLRMFYGAYLNVGINGQYGDCQMSDIICGYDNFEACRNGFSGFKVVELTYYYAFYNENTRLIVCNFPSFDCHGYKHVRLYFPEDNANDYFSVITHFSKLKSNDKDFWNKIMVVAGQWTKHTPDKEDDSIAHCTVHKRTQHFYVAD